MLTHVFVYFILMQTCRQEALNELAFYWGTIMPCPFLGVKKIIFINNKCIKKEDEES